MFTNQKIIFLILASFLLFACNLFEDGFYESEAYENNEYADEEAYEKDAEEAQNEELDELSGSPELSIESIPEYADPAFKVFSQYVDVFGVGVYATGDIPEAKVFHAAGVMAQYLDNDENGQPDDPAVIRELRARQASIFIFPHPDSRAEEEFFDSTERLLDSGKLALQPCYSEEIVPNGAAQGEFDASLEEILHLITNTGYANAYPEVFGEKRGTAIADAMDKARGGYFEDVPSSYPAEAWYSYDDKTCDYACMISEYHYWALTSLLSGQNFAGRANEISHEWKLNTSEKLRSGDPDIYALLTDPRYHSPIVLPDGKYSP